MKTIIQIDKNGKEIGEPKKVSENFWNGLQKFGKNLRWKEYIVKEKKDGTKKRSGSGNAVK